MIFRATFVLIWFAIASLAAAQGNAAADKKSQGRLSSALHRLAAAADRGDFKTLDKAGVQVDRGVRTLRVVIELADWSAAADVTSAVEQAGGHVDASAKPLLRATVPVERLRRLSETPGIKHIRQPYRPRQKEIISEGVRVTAAGDFVRASGANGGGVSVAILDAGFKGVEALIPAELPEGRVSATQFVRDRFATYASAHGTACAEIVHDMAPGARLVLAGFEDEVTWAQALDELVSAGVRIISHSIGWDNVAVPNGDSFWARKVDEIASQGVLLITAAGNEGENYYQGAWQDVDRDLFLEFGSGGAELLPLGVVGGGSITLRWDDPFGSSRHDYDLLVVRHGFVDDSEISPDNPNVVASSFEGQDGDDDPLEGAEWESDAPEELYVVIVRDPSSSASSAQRLWVYSTNGIPEGYRSGSASLSLPGDARGALTVGAFEWQSAGLESYSSRGPTEDSRIKPDLTGPDAVSTRSYGVDGAPGPFPGTSAATPHVAGAAALILSYRPTLTREELINVLLNSADGSMLERQSGTAVKSNAWGWGRLSFSKLLQSSRVP